MGSLPAVGHLGFHREIQNMVVPLQSEDPRVELDLLAAHRAVDAPKRQG